MIFYILTIVENQEKKTFLFNIIKKKQALDLSTNLPAKLAEPFFFINFSY
jgi:hypothetical protein